jgi:stress response protein YsnF
MDTNYKEYENNEKSDDEIYQLVKDQKLKNNKRFRPFCLCPPDVIESRFSKASEINRNNLLEYKEKKINKRVPLVLTIQVGKRIKDKQERVFGSVSYKHYIWRA